MIQGRCRLAPNSTGCINHAMNDPYAPMIRFADPARDGSSFGRIALTFMICDAMIMFGPLIMLVFLPSQAAVDHFFDGTTPLTVLGQFAAFGFAAIGITITVRHMHQRGFWSMVGPDPAQAIANMWTCAKLVAIVTLIQITLPPWINLAALEEIKPLFSWAIWLPAALIVIIIQAGTEELLFRGYLQQQLAALSRNKWLWMVLPSVLFGVSHYFNGYGPADGVFYAIWASGLGLACADLTARTGNIGAALGLHLANNMFALTLVGVKGWPNTGLMLMLYPYEDPYAYDYSMAAFFTFANLLDLIVSLLMIYVLWLTARIAVRR